VIKVYRLSGTPCIVYLNLTLYTCTCDCWRYSCSWLYSTIGHTDLFILLFR